MNIQRIKRRIAVKKLSAHAQPHPRSPPARKCHAPLHCGTRQALVPDCGRLALAALLPAVAARRGGGALAPSVGAAQALALVVAEVGRLHRVQLVDGIHGRRGKHGVR